MDPLMLIRSGIFLVAGLLLLMFADRARKIYVDCVNLLSRKLYLPHRCSCSRRAMIIEGIILLTISAVLLALAMIL